MATIPRGKMGNTRRPLGLHDSLLLTAFDSGNAHLDAGQNPAALSSSVGSVAILSGSGQLSDGLNQYPNGNEAGANGYWTGNAKLLHVYISGAAAAAEPNSGVVIHGYNYDIGKWAKLEIQTGHASPGTNDGRSKNLNLQSDGYTPAAVRIGPGGSAVMRTIKINGIDRVGFVLTGSSTIGRFDVRASVSTV
jgi:hypothetical protein